MVWTILWGISLTPYSTYEIDWIESGEKGSPEFARWHVSRAQPIAIHSSWPFLINLSLVSVHDQNFLFTSIKRTFRLIQKLKSVPTSLNALPFKRFIQKLVNNHELLYHFAMAIAGNVYPNAESTLTELCCSPRERTSGSALLKSTPLSSIGLPRFVSDFSTNGPPEEESDHSTCKRLPCEEDLFSAITSISSLHGENHVLETSSSMNSKYHHNIYNSQYGRLTYM